jgi:ectoine hydroxylase-related dioxygenase (phytanoyl-CoA dioxygenase family)
MLTASQIEQYRRDGFVILHDWIDKQTVAGLQKAADEVKALCGPLVKENPRVQLDYNGDKIQFRKIEPLVDLSKTFSDMAKDPRLVQPLEQLLGPVALFEDKLNFKLPGGSGFAMHQDYAYWTQFSPRLATALVYVDEATQENGCLEVVPGRHKEGVFPIKAVQAGSATDQAIPADVIDPASAILAPGGAGTVLLFDCHVPHASKPNHSQKQRRAIIYSYGPVADKTPYEYDYFAAEYEKWLKEWQSKN